MRTTILNDIYERARTLDRDIPRQWFIEQASNLTKDPKQLIQENTQNLESSVDIGRLYLFLYDPKTKKKLPYYDMAPLSMILEKGTEGFVGVNFHYLPPQLRLGLLGSEPRTILRSKEVKPLMRNYLYSNVKSRFLNILQEEWDMVSALPVERFRKQNKSTVWNETLGEI